MTEMEKMLAGELYCGTDPELMEMWNAGKNLLRVYNQLDYADTKTQREILEKLLASVGENLHIYAPFYADYGKFISIGSNCVINMSCVFLDCNRITIGDNVLIAPGVHIYAVGHPLRPKDRFTEKNEVVGRTAPVTIGSNVWIGGGSVILPGVTIGDNVTIGAGSVVTKSIPEGMLAFGNPCRSVRAVGA